MFFTDEASTRVTELTTGNPIEGRNYTIHCDITDGNPQNGRDYEWKRDGEKLAETGATLTIPEVNRSMHGSNYTCAADNGAGMGQHGAAFTITVWCKSYIFVEVVNFRIKETGR